MRYLVDEFQGSRVLKDDFFLLLILISLVLVFVFLLIVLPSIDFKDRFLYVLT